MIEANMAQFIRTENDGVLTEIRSRAVQSTSQNRYRLSLLAQSLATDPVSKDIFFVLLHKFTPAAEVLRVFIP
jgi:hypothetical protein